jgi:hypothetical protein
LLAGSGLPGGRDDWRQAHSIIFMLESKNAKVLGMISAGADKVPGTDCRYIDARKSFFGF